MHNIRACRTRMGVVIWKQRIHPRLPHTLHNSCRITPMIHENRIRPETIRYAFTIRREPARVVCKAAAFPGIIRCRARDNDFRALRNDCAAGIGEIRGVSKDGDLLAVVGRFTGLGASARARGTPVITGGERAAVVVAEFDDDDVVGSDPIDDGLEAAFDGKGAG